MGCARTPYFRYGLHKFVRLDDDITAMVYSSMLGSCATMRVNFNCTYFRLSDSTLCHLTINDIFGRLFLFIPLSSPFTSTFLWFLSKKMPIHCKKMKIYGQNIFNVASRFRLSNLTHNRI